MIGAKVYTTRTTSFVVPDPLTTGDWYWRVTANKGAGLISLPRPSTRFDIQALATPQITYPANDVNQTIEDVVLDWTPVARRARPTTSRWRSTRASTTSRCNVKNVVGTRYSPATTLNSDQFWWRVRAVDLAGQPTPWTESLLRLPAAMARQAAAGVPRSATEHPAHRSTATSVLPVDARCSMRRYYELYMAANANITVGVDKCAVVGHDVRPAQQPATAASTPGGTTYWQVRPWTSRTPARPARHLLRPPGLHLDRPGRRGGTVNLDTSPCRT